MGCMKICPVEAIRVKDKKSRLLVDKCIDCGECVKVCRNDAIVPLTNSFTDFSKFKYTIAVPSIALYSQLDIETTPGTILTSLKNLGFDEVLDLTQACVSVYKAITGYINEYTGKRPLISSFCPTCVKLLQTMYPELLEQFIPVIPPMELAAREIKKETAKRLGLHKSDIGVIYITPCSSKMLLISQKSGSFYSDFDGAIAVSDIYKSLYSSVHQHSKSKSHHTDYYDISGFGLNIGVKEGLSSMIGNDKSISVSGISNVLRILEEIEQGKLNNIDLVDLNSCDEGCIGGPMMVDNVYLARSKMLHLVNTYGEKKIAVRKKDRYEGCKLFYDSLFEQAHKGNGKGSISEEIQRIMHRKELSAKLPNINCGACGSPTCISLAEDIVKGDAKMNDCLFIFNEELKNKLKEKIKEILELQQLLEKE